MAFYHIYYDDGVWLIRPGAKKDESDTIEDLNNNIVFDDDAIFYIKDLLNCSEDKADSIPLHFSRIY